MRYILLLTLLFGGMAFAEQGIRPEPTGCPSGDSIPIDSDKCDHTIKATHGLPTREEPVEFQGHGASGSWEATLPSVGSKTIPQN